LGIATQAKWLHSTMPDSYLTGESEMRVFRLFVAAMVAALSACASTSLDNTWKDPQYTAGPVSRILVVGISTQASVRRAFEETFAQALTEQGVQAVASYTLIPEDGKIPEDALKKAAEQAGADGVLITRMVGRTTNISVSPSPAPLPPPGFGMRRGYYGYYTGAWVGYYEPTTVQTTNYVIAETTLFRKDAPEPVWSATSRTVEPRDVRKATEGFAKVMIARLRKEGLI
jgi:hypothetical protein